MRLGVAIAVGTLLLVAWMRGLREAASAHAGPATLYVDGTTGSDTTDCTSYAGPFATTGSALGQAGGGERPPPTAPGLGGWDGSSSPARTTWCSPGGPGNCIPGSSWSWSGAAGPPGTRRSD